MKATKKRCPLPFLILLAALWFAQSMQVWNSDTFPARRLSLVEPPEQAYVQIVPGHDTNHRSEIWKEISTP